VFPEAIYSVSFITQPLHLSVATVSRVIFTLSAHVCTCVGHGFPFSHEELRVTERGHPSQPLTVLTTG
jgi:hypothetical protein